MILFLWIDFIPLGFLLFFMQGLKNPESKAGSYMPGCSASDQSSLGQQLPRGGPRWQDEASGHCMPP